MKQQQAAPKTSTASTTTTGAETSTGPKTATPDQNTLGNSAVKANIAPAAEESSALLAEDAPAVDKSKPKVNNKRGPTDDKKPVAAPAAAAKPEVAADPSSRPTKFKKGMSGALIGGGADITLTSDPGKGSTVAIVKDGVAAKIVEAAGNFVKVSTRVGDKNVTGWVSTAVFSDQPSLAKDEDDAKLEESLEYHMVEGDQSPEANPDKKSLTTQGGLGDCYLIASMAAIHFANPDFAKRLIKYDAKAKRYIVTFYQEDSKGKMKPIEIVVDGNLPMAPGSKSDPAYGGDPGEAMWGAIVEKAYAKWKGGYEQIVGGDGGQAMEELTGVKSRAKNPASMKESDVIPYFQDAVKNNLAIYAGVVNSVKVDKQTPLAGSASGPYTGKVSQQHDWNGIQVSSLSIKDASGKVGIARDDGEEDAKTGKIVGSDVKSGEVGYKDSSIKVEYGPGKAPKTPGDLEVHFETHGVVLPSKMIIGNHAYSFSGVVGDQLQFYNPWGSNQPKPITAAEFLKYFDSLSTNAVPNNKVGGP